VSLQNSCRPVRYIEVNSHTRTLPVAIVLALTAAVLPAQTPDIHYVPTPDAVVDTMLAAAQVGATDVVYDLGSGDGRIVIEAARKYGARGVGIELDAALNSKAFNNARKAGVADRVTFVQADFFKVDLSEATVVTLFLSPNINQRLQPKLRRELKPGARVVSHRFPMPPGWKPDRDIHVKGTRVFLWTIR
jgi:cyclopropane fatty-acyl-phospholipid synthase-like methyltransferase